MPNRFHVERKNSKKVNCAEGHTLSLKFKKGVLVELLACYK